MVKSQPTGPPSTMGITCQFISAVILKIGSDDLKDHLHEVVGIRVMSQGC